MNIKQTLFGNRPSGRYHQGVYYVKNREKYIGSKEPYYRSSYELKFMQWCDYNTNVIKWSSEPFPVKYLNEADNKEHNYWVDFYADMINKNGKQVRYLFEVKPFSQTREPKKPKINNRKSNRNYLYASETYKKNMSKWRCIDIFCKSNGMQFKIITERELGI